MDNLIEARDIIRRLAESPLVSVSLEFDGCNWPGRENE